VTCATRGGLRRIGEDAIHRVKVNGVDPLSCPRNFPGVANSSPLSQTFLFRQTVHAVETPMKNELVHEIWLNPEPDGQLLPGLCLAGPMEDGFRALLNKGAIKAGEITGHSHFDVMTKYWKLQGWGEYQTEHRQDHELYPEEWVLTQRPFIEQTPKGRPMQVSLVLELYEKQGQVLKNSLHVELSDLEFFKRVLSVPDHDPLMFGSYKIDTISNSEIFEKYGFMLDLGRYDCYAGYRQIL